MQRCWLACLLGFAGWLSLLMTQHWHARVDRLLGGRRKDDVMGLHVGQAWLHSRSQSSCNALRLARWDLSYRSRHRPPSCPARTQLISCLSSNAGHQEQVVKVLQTWTLAQDVALKQPQALLRQGGVHL